VTRYRPHLCVLVLVALTFVTGLHAPLRNALTALRFAWVQRDASGGVVLVAIDPPSLKEIGVWPWPRTLHAKLIDRLEAAGAAEIAFDIDFSSPSTPDADRALEEALARADGSVLLPAFQQVTRGEAGGVSLHVTRPLPQFARHSWAAAINVEPDADGIVRRYPFGQWLGDEFVPSAAALLAGRYERGDPTIIDFGIRAATVPVVSYVDVLDGKPAALSLLAGKKVIVGATALELGDRFNVPTGRILTGALLQAIATETILQNRTLRSSPALLTMAELAILALVLVALWRRFSTAVRVGLLLAIAIAAEVSAMVAQGWAPLVIDTSLMHVAVIGYLIAILIDEIDFRGMLARIAESRFERIATSIGDGLVCVNRSGTVTVWNAAASAMFGYRADEMIGRPVAPLIASEPWDRLVGSEFVPQTVGATGGKLMELVGRRKTGEMFPLEASFSTWRGTDGINYGLVVRDISQRKQEQDRIWQLATYDSLTGIANRNTLYEHLEETLGVAEPGVEVALMILDLDKFKDVNDTLGHACGDDVLKEVGVRLTRLVGPEGGLIARLGGDEFAIVLADSFVQAVAENLSLAILNSFRESDFIIGAHRFKLGCSIGVALFPRDCDQVEELLGNADIAMYRAKSGGAGRHVFYDPAIRSEVEERLSLMHDLEGASDRDEFELFYQPQIRLLDGKIVGAEALLRWRHPVRGLIMPGEFLPVLQGSSVVEQAARWVMKSACEQGRVWQQRGQDIRVSVNLFPSQFNAGDLAAEVAGILQETGLPPQFLELEVTENILLADDERAREIFSAIRKLGVGIALDDFGTGYASLSYLKKFPLTRVKIDQSFVRELEPQTTDAAIVEATVRLSKLLGLVVTAEGIEHRPILALLKTMGCEEGQGYYFGAPMPADQFERTFLAEKAVSTQQFVDLDADAAAA